MKLSEAILLGSTLSPQAIGVYEDSDGRRCALGAALAAIGENITSEADVSLLKHWPIFNLDLYPTMCPGGCDGSSSMLGAFIVHLNDIHRWTREQIAAFVAQLESMEPETSKPIAGRAPSHRDSLEATAV